MEIVTETTIVWKARCGNSPQAAKDQKEETKSLNNENGVDEETLASFLSHLEKINFLVERIVQNNEKIRETQKHFFSEPSTSGRERYQDEHKNLMKVSVYQSIHILYI